MDDAHRGLPGSRPAACPACPPRRSRCTEPLYISVLRGWGEAHGAQGQYSVARGYVRTAAPPDGRKHKSRCRELGATCKKVWECPVALAAAATARPGQRFSLGWADGWMRCGGECFSTYHSAC